MSLVNILNKSMIPLLLASRLCPGGGGVRIVDSLGVLAADGVLILSICHIK